jgi:hypothetical protein
LNELTGYFKRLAVVLQRLTSSGQVNQADVAQTQALLREAHRALKKNLAAADDIRLPALKNVNAGEPLSSYLLSSALLREPKNLPGSIDGKWIGRFLEQLGEVADKAKRIQAKNVGGILAFQEKIARDWQACRQPAAAGTEKRQVKESKLQ